LFGHPSNKKVQLVVKKHTILGFKKYGTGLAFIKVKGEKLKGRRVAKKKRINPGNYPIR